MKKKIVLGLAAAGTAVAMIPLFAAFEAHVINVTAKIENALRVATNEIKFGTVFPQEHLRQPLGVGLSDSFMQEPRVDDVEYFIRQKPKCGITTNGGQVLVGPTATGHVIVDRLTGIVTIECGPKPRELTTGETWGLLPDLCPYISKEGEDPTDGDTPSFHKPWEVVLDDNDTPNDPLDDFYKIQWLDTLGRLAKSESDYTDIWTIDLAVPCFGGECAQDWADFVHGINPRANPDDYDQDKEDEHKIFGCDLWVEVSNVSEAQPTPIPTPTPTPEGGGQG